MQVVCLWPTACHVYTAYQESRLHSREVSDEIERFFGGQVFGPIINRTIRFADSTTLGKPILLTNTNSPGANAYRELAEEIFNNGKESFH